MVKAKVKTKSHVLGAFKGIGKKMAGFRGDVAVDGEQKVVSSSLRCNVPIRQEEIADMLEHEGAYRCQD